MKAKPDCIACLFKQALNTIRVVTPDPVVWQEVLRRTEAHAQGASMDQTPAALSQHVYRIVSEVTGVADPYRELKRHTNESALRMLPDLERIVNESADPLKAAIHMAAAGNIVDLGIGEPFDLEQDIAKLMAQPFAIDDYARFRADIRPGAKLLYLGDNAGEIVFDRVLVEHLIAHGLNVTVSVKSGPVINDAIMEDARTAGIASLVPVIETGSNDIGVHWDHVSAEFRAAFEGADIVISKGQGNFETCSDRPENVYFLLKAKCEMVARELGVAFGDTVFKRSFNR